MNKIPLSLIVLLLLISNCIFAQESDWQEAYFLGRKVDDKVSKTEGNITFTIDSLTCMAERNNVVAKTKKYIAQNLELISESMFTDSVNLLLARDKEGIDKFANSSISYIKGEQGAPINLMMCAYSEKRDAIKSEMMHMIVKLKWGLPKEPTLKWLSEGLATLADPDMDTCDGQTIEERYVYFLQNEKLLDKNILLQFENVDTIPQLKIAQNQSAYIVDYLLKKDGAEKLKSIYQNGMDSFEETYGFSFEKMVENINTELNSKYPNPIDFNWETFSKECFLATIYADWHPLYLKRGVENIAAMESKMEGNIRYTVPLTMSMDMREETIMKTKEYIAKNLELINESELNDSIHIVLVRSREEMGEVLGGTIGGLAHVASEDDPENRLISVFNDNHHPLKHELMHIISELKWGQSGLDVLWLEEGLAVFANPEAEDCDGYTLEERYVYLLQSDRLLDVSNLKSLPSTKIGYSQSGYIVEYLYKKYGVNKLRNVWISGICDFEKVYGLSFEDMISNINVELNKKYSDSVGLTWEVFSRECIE